MTRPNGRSGDGGQPRSSRHLAVVDTIGPRRRSLRIAQLAPPVQPVPPRNYGGTERVVSTLTEELVRRGHEVTLFASGDSRTSARLVPTVECGVWRDERYTDDRFFFMIAVDQVYRRAHEFDVIHNHVDGLAYPTARACRQTPTLSTLHGRQDLPELQALYRHFADVPLVSISNAQRRPLPWANWVATVYNGIDLTDFPFRAAHDGYLAFLGRISPEKGLDVAIRIASRAGLPLKIGARLPLNQPHNPEAQRDWRYFKERVEPHLGDPGVEFLGELAGPRRGELLGGAAALLFPIAWPEPFGLVMPEAMACGTPVVALRRGSAPEVVEHGVTGFLADDEDGMARALTCVHTLDRRRCRQAVEQRFSPATMADGYERAYQACLQQAQLRRAATPPSRAFHRPFPISHLSRGSA